MWNNYDSYIQATLEKKLTMCKNGKQRKTLKSWGQLSGRGRA
jgi:hypothetical protein